MNSPTLEPAAALIARRSITPDDAGCQKLVQDRLERLGFACSTPESGGATNLWARRGVADMKSSIVAFVAAMGAFVAQNPGHPGSIAILLTSDEGGPATDGTTKVVEMLAEWGERPDFCKAGKTTSVQRLGDMFKNGRRGSLPGKLVVYGVQDHISYPCLGRNPVHLAAAVMPDLARTSRDDGNADFPPKIDAVTAAIRTVTGLEPETPNIGGISDGPYLAGICDQVVEFGPVNATSHKLNDCVAVRDLEPLSLVDRELPDRLLPGGPAR